jgi:hypothetical protein
VERSPYTKYHWIWGNSEILKCKVHTEHTCRHFLFHSFFGSSESHLFTVWPRVVASILYPWELKSLPKSYWEIKTAESRKMPRLLIHTDSQTERSFRLQFFQCHFKLQPLANQQAPCSLTSRTSQFPPAAERFSLSFFFKLKWRLVSCLKEYTAFPAGV